MLPAQRNKVDISKLTPAEQQAFRMYGKLPSRSVNKVQERKYFDSGDYALAKAGKQKEYGKEIPTPEAIPHASPSPAAAGLSGSPPTGSGTGTPSSSLGGGGFSSGSTNSTPAIPGAIPLAGPAGGSGMNDDSSANLSMSPGRVGVGVGASQPLATSPTRTFGSFPLAHSHAHNSQHLVSSTSPTGSSGVGGFGGASSSGSGLNYTQNPLANREQDAMGTTTSGSALGSNNAMIGATTGNQAGRTQHMRRPSAGEAQTSSGSVTSPPPTSGLANVITREEEPVEGMELQ